MCQFTDMNKIMGISTIAAILITFGVILLVLGSLPMENRLEGNTLTVNFIIGKKIIDMTDARFMPVPEEVNHNIIRIGGTSLGKKHSGNFMNTRTKTKYLFYLTGKGEKVYFTAGGKRYLVDGIPMK